MNVVSVTCYEDNHRTVKVSCADCNCSHEINWPNGAMSVEMPCNRGTIEIPAWCFTLRRRTRYHHDPTREHSVIGEDDAITVPVPNWLE